MAPQCVQCPQLFELRAPTSDDDIECCPHHCRDPPCDPCNKRRNSPRFWRRPSCGRYSCGRRKFAQGPARRSGTTKWAAPTTPNTIIYLLIPTGGDTVRVFVLMGSAAFKLAGRTRGQYQHNLQYYLYPCITSHTMHSTDFKCEEVDSYICALYMPMRISIMYRTM